MKVFILKSMNIVNRHEILLHDCQGWENAKILCIYNIKGLLFKRLHKLIIITIIDIFLNCLLSFLRLPLPVILFLYWSRAAGLDKKRRKRSPVRATLAQFGMKAAYETDKWQLRLAKQWKIHNCCAQVVTETCLNHNIRIKLLSKSFGEDISHIKTIFAVYIHPNSGF